ncbi:hypothetical protein K2173_016958 [Erythroxylum novogranatense]|uniref:Glycosyltransferase 61 catalytic domain-containing protein n=1 Tax=Erythroxylum novogranatense TaxID=1862640 RepID=A0AAV8U5B6_9ROSI|nr:hypothetical protein K2173_016958 [Erythroxylum novogranatense]
MKKSSTKWGCLRVRRLVALCLACFSTFLVYQIRLSFVHLLKSRVLTAPGLTNSTSNPTVKIKPYPRKFEGFVMGRIKDIAITSGLPKKPCQVPHDVPALVFCAGGYTGNFFHEFNDGFIPLFITVNTIFPNQDFVIVISQGHDWWLNKYVDLLNVFTKHPIINLDNETTTHCFPSANIGLISHGFMIINDTLIPKSKSYFHFRSLLHKAYGQNFASSSPMSSFPKSMTRPRLLIVIRSGDIGRVIVNQDEVIKEMEEVGFDVIVFQPTSSTSLRDAYALVSSSHAMVGVHGAALTHSLFLRPGSVLVQVVPIGVEWASDASFGRVGRGLNLEYLEYRIGVEESSLVEKYGSESRLLKDPHALQIKGTGWPTEIMDIYLKEQNVRLDLVRFRKYLEKAYVKAKNFMYKEG